MSCSLTVPIEVIKIAHNVLLHYLILLHTLRQNTPVSVPQETGTDSAVVSSGYGAESLTIGRQALAHATDYG